MVVVGVVLAGCGLPELSSEDVFGRDSNPKAWAYGTVKDAANGGPIAGATIQLARGSVVSDDNGAFRFDSVGVGDAEIAVSKAGYETLGQSYRMHAGGNRLDITLAKLNCGCSGGQVCDLTTRACVEPARISGIVTDACTGAGLVARVTVSGVSGCTDFGPKSYWELGGLFPGGPQTLAAGRGGYQPFTTQVTLKSGFNTIEPIQLTPIGGCGAVPPAWTCQ